MANEPIEIVFTAHDYCEGLKAIPETVKSIYKNIFPQNCLFNQGNGVFSGDCWNSIIKAFIWGKGVLPKNKGGYWYNPGRYGLGDWNGAQILAKCSDVSSDFTKIAKGEMLITAAKDHVGIYVGDYQVNGKTYNVIECTPAWNGGIQKTYVDAQGRRFNTKGGGQLLAWAQHGKLPWIDYTEAPKDVPLKYTISTSGNTQTINVIEGKGTITITTQIK